MQSNTLAASEFEVSSLSSLPEDHFRPIGKPDNTDPILTALERASCTLELLADAVGHGSNLYEALFGVRAHVQQAKRLMEVA